MAAIIFDSEYSGDPVGRVENSGIVFDSEYGGDPVGRVEGFPLLKAGAAYLLLLMNNNQS